MSVGWLLDAVAFDYYHDEIAAAVVRNGHSVVSVKRPDPPYQWDDVQATYRRAFPRGACVVTHGDIDLVQRVRADRLWTPGVFATIERFFCSHYYARLGSFLLNEHYAMVPYGELPRCSPFLFDTLGRSGELFVRPDSPLKLFTGMTIARATFERDYEFMGFHGFPAETLVVVSSRKQIVAEWRFVVADRCIVSGSQYVDRDQKISRPANDPRALQFANQVVAAGYEPDPVWVLDVCQTDDQRYHLLEIGGFSFAGLYACNKDAVVQAVSEVAHRIHAAVQ